MSSVGLIVLARNEAAVLGRCLSSVAGDIDQAVVVDMQSDDATAGIARAGGAEVVSVPIQRPWDSARMFGIERLRTDYVLILDADEWAPGVLGQPEVKAAVRDGFAVSFPKKNYLGGRWVRGNRWWPNHQVRLFPRRSVTITNDWHNYLHVSAPIRKLPACERFCISHAGLDDAAALVVSTARFFPAEPRALRRRDAVRAFAVAAYGYWREGGFRDGTDGVAIAACNWLNAAAKVAAPGQSSPPP